MSVSLDFFFKYFFLLLKKKNLKHWLVCQESHHVILQQQTELCKYVQLNRNSSPTLAICVYCNGTNHSLSAPIVAVCVNACI